MKYVNYFTYKIFVIISLFLALHNGVLLVEQVPDGVVLVAEAALYHDPHTLVPPYLHVRAVSTHQVSCLELTKIILLGFSCAVSFMMLSPSVCPSKSKN
jgi:hypothetical protein